ncbi:MAG: NYN domain-containing protein [Chloroflexota bacterium]|nr:NYN domain-containing protein [Chloroflexota bacterium]
MRTSVYIDGFNLYYGCAKGTPYRWLDLGKLCSLLLRGHTITRLRYFTALVGPRPGDPDKRFRQQTYIRALETIPGLSVHYGHFLSGPERMLVANPLPGRSRTVEVVRTQEKGSDVNLATFLLMDGFRGDYELAVVISNDSDLKTPIELLRAELGLQVGVLSPHRNTSHALRTAASFYQPIRKGVVAASLFPGAMSDARGRTITKPPRW